MSGHCPGVKELVKPRIIIRTCPNCGSEVEFFSDEAEAICSNCGKLVYREVTSSCITWCPYALQCIADLKNRKLIPPSRAEELERIAKKKEKGKETERDEFAKFLK
jgi:predicted RNA-binding Zn-ribbon protein involved in translation (DUF1610 family)